MPAPDQLTLRDVAPRLRSALEREARRRGLSLNRTALALLAEATGLAEGVSDRDRPTSHHDLDALAGTWDDEEGRSFDQALAEQRRVDPKLWK